jgi:hypothetical protein
MKLADDVDLEQVIFIITQLHYFCHVINNFSSLSI